MSDFNKEFTAASSVPLILSILSKGESYGYEIIQQVSLLSAGQVEWSDGMLYPVLHKMEKKGYVSSRWKIGDNGRKRKYYQILEEGKKQLHKEQANWRLITSIFDQLWIPNLPST